MMRHGLLALAAPILLARCWNARPGNRYCCGDCRCDYRTCMNAPADPPIPLPATEWGQLHWTAREINSFDDRISISGEMMNGSHWSVASVGCLLTAYRGNETV